MRKVWIVALKEYKDVVQKKSFLIGALLTPLIVGAAMFLPILLAKESETPDQTVLIVDLENEGYGERFQQALKEITLPDGRKQFSRVELEKYSSPESSDWLERRVELDSLVQSGSFDGVLLTLPGTITADSLKLISKSFDFKAFSRMEKAISSIIVHDRLQHSSISMPVDSVVKLTSSVDLEVQTPAGKSRNPDSLFGIVMILWMIMYMTILIYGQGVMRSVIEEKNSRIAEVMVSSVTPFQLLLGKLVGLGGATLTQLAIWGGLGLAVRYGVAGEEIASAATTAMSSGVITPVILIFFALFFVLGFLLYSTVFASVGAIVSTEKESQSFMMPIVFLLMIPIFIMAPVLQAPFKGWVVGLSLVPFVTPILMMVRLVVADPSGMTLSEPIVLQALLGVVVVTLTLVFMVWVSAKIFRVGILMTGKRATMPEIIRWIRRS